tara:strand:+ start:683 stop:1408 length:726 start_codon:yes stop_codon:yes gene_type:complete
MYTITTTRFNDKTYIENNIWKCKNNYKGCIYGSPHRICDTISKCKPIIVIEMNNEINKIMGIGCIDNRVKFNKKIHDEQKYNRYIYMGKKYIKRRDVKKDILEHLEYILFKTSHHYKRLRGITKISTKRFGVKLDTDFKLGDIVKKISSPGKGIEGIVINVKNDKITVKYNDKETNEQKRWSSRYGMLNYVKLKKKKCRRRKKGVYRCRLCGEYKKDHSCVANIYSEKLRKKIYIYLINLF